MSAWMRIKRLFSTTLPENDALPKATEEAACSKKHLDDTIHRAERTSKAVELRALRDTVKSDRLVNATNEAVEILQHAARR